MKEKKINYGLIIIVAIIIVLFIPIISNYISKQNINFLNYKNIKEKIDAGETFILYIGDSKDKDATKSLKSLREDKKTTDYSYAYDIYGTENSNEIRKLFGNKSVYAIIIEGDIQSTYVGSDKNSFLTDVDEFIIGNVTDKNKSYKVAKDFKQYKKLVKSDSVIMSVFGTSECYHCNRFKPVYNAVADKYDLDIYFFDSSEYNSEEYNKIVNMNLTVPAICSGNNKKFKLSDGFGTPLTIFTKENKVIDCIAGYVNRASLIEKLKEVKMIEE